MSDEEERLAQRRTQLMKRARGKRQALVRKVRRGYEGEPPPKSPIDAP